MSPRPRRSWLLPVVAVLTVAVGAGSRPAAGHSILVSSEPATGAVVPELATARFTFADELALDGEHRVLLRAADGHESTPVSLEVVDGVTLVASFQVDLPDGDHELAWEAVAADGHRERGLVPFTIEAAAVSAPPPAPSPPSTVAQAPTSPPFELVEVAPAPGERVTDLEEVRFEFSSELASGGDHAVVVTTADGAQLAAEALDLVEPSVLVASFGDVPAGDHELRWRAEGLDGSRPTGSLAITVAVAEPRDGPATVVAVVVLVAVAGIALAAFVARRRRRSPRIGERTGPNAV